MLPVTQRRVVTVPHSLAVMAAITCLATLVLSDREAGPEQEPALVLHESVEFDGTVADSDDSASASRATRGNGNPREAGTADRVQWPDVGDWTTILLPGRRSGN